MAFARGLTAGLLCLGLAGCIHTTPNEASPLSSPAADAAGTSQDLAIQTLSVVDVLFRGRLQQRSESDALIDVDHVVWTRSQHWNVGKQERVTPLSRGPGRFRVPGWLELGELPLDSPLLFGVTSPYGEAKSETYGQLRLVASSTGDVLTLGSSSLESLQQIADKAAPRRGVSPSGDKTSILVELMEDAGARTDALNLGRGVPTQDLLAAVTVPPTTETTESFANQDPRTRQLPMVPEDVPGLEAIVGRPVTVSEAAFFWPGESSPPRYLAVRFTGSGVLGPVRTTPSLGYATANGVFPTTGGIELLDVQFPPPSAGPDSQVIQTWDLPAWPGPGDFRLRFDLTAAKAWSMSVVDGAEIDREVTARARG